MPSVSRLKSELDESRGADAINALADLEEARDELAAVTSAMDHWRKVLSHKVDDRRLGKIYL